jgi:hypothetical protein
MRRLAASGLLPERAGQPVKGWAHVSLAELRAMDDGSALEGQWITAVRAKWAAARAAASVGGSDGAAWLDGAAARAMMCDAVLTPVVTGDVDTSVLDGLVRLCAQLHQIDHPGQANPSQPDPGQNDASQPDPGQNDASQDEPGQDDASQDEPGQPEPGQDEPGQDEPGPQSAQASPPDAPASPAREALQKAIIGKAVDLLSGPGGLASFLRTQQLGARLGGPSLPLDIGYSDKVPAWIRNAVTLRDKHCQWAGGCHQPAAACEVHHVKHKANGGPTSLKGCVLLCFFHHQIVIHRWGWTLVLNPDGTTTAWNRDRTKVLHSHSPPARAG